MRMEPNKMREHYTSGELALLPEEVPHFLAQVGEFTDQVFFELAAYAGIRRDDIVRIEQANFFPEENKLLYKERKKKDRIWTTYLSPDLTAKVKTVCNINKGRKWIFPSSGKKRGASHISGRAMYDKFQKYLKKGGYKPRPFHTLRATAIKSAKARGWTPEQTARLVGDKVQTIQIHYLTPGDSEMKKLAGDMR
jgi:integrase